VREQLERLVSDMLDKGVHYEDARREFERLFIARALQRTNGNLCDAADLLGLHRNTIARKMAEYRIKRAWVKGPGSVRTGRPLLDD
jgi:DNA-binding NtrC family response regulator